MSKRCGIDDLLVLFEDSVTPGELLASKIMSQTSSAIIRERLKMQMGQKEFAQYLEVSQSLVSRWEHGECNFSLKKIAEIAAKLDLDVNISFCNASAKLQSSSIDYTTPTEFTKTVRYNSADSNYASRKYVSSESEQVAILTTKKQEVYRYATVC